MKIGIFSPVSLQEIKDLIYENEREALPDGLKFTVVSSLIRRYLELGHEVVVVTLDKTIPVERVFHGDNLLVYVGKYRKSQFIRGITFFKTEIQQMYMFVRNNECDIYHAHWEYEFAIAALKESKNKTIVTLHDWPFTVLKYMPNYYRALRLLMSLYVFKKAKYFTAVSPYIEGCFKKCRPFVPIRLIPNAVATLYDHLEPKKLNQKKPVIISVNNGFTKLKNVDTLMLAFQHVLDRYNEAELYLYGNEFGNHEKAYNWAIRNHVSTEHIHFEGFVEHKKIYEKMRRADILVHPSKEESFGLIFIEAMLSGTPTIGGEKSGAVSWVLEDGKAGLITDVDSVDELAYAILSVLDNEEKWEDYRKYGYDSANKRFSVRSVAEEYLDYYLEIIKKEGSIDEKGGHFPVR